MNMLLRFSLRIKLALVSVLLLAIPLTGFYFAAQMQAYLLSAQERALSLTAKAVSTILYERPDLFEANILQSFDEQKEIHAYMLNNQITLDGYTDDWQDLLGEAKYYGFDNVLEFNGVYEDATLNFKHIIGVRNDYYYILFIVNDDSLVFRNPNYSGLNKSDHLRIAIQGENQDRINHYFMSPRGSAKLNGHLMRQDPSNFVPEKYEPRIFGYWRKTPVGYTIEIRMPVSMVKNNRISFAIADVDDPVTRKIHTIVGTSGTDKFADLGFLLSPSPQLENIISSLYSPSARISVIDDRLRQRASVGQFYGEPDIFQIRKQNKFSLADLLNPIYAFFSDRYKEERSQTPRYLSQIEDKSLRDTVRDGEPFIIRRSIPNSDAEILIAGEPIKYENKIMGTVLVEQATNSILSEKNKIIEKAINISLIVFLLGGLVIIGFASRLSGRIRQLAAQTEHAIGKDGRIQANFEVSRIHDELGDLSRRFGEMLQQLKEYSNYQEKMADNLEHEIRTPIAGISAAIANLEKKIDKDDAAVKNHLFGIKENVIRIDAMMTSIREATSLENALKSSEKTVFDLKEALIVWIKEGYKQTFPENSFVVNFPTRPVNIYGDSIRIRQMLDKLIENGVDFNAAGNPIVIELSLGVQQAVIKVANEGPELPAELKNHIFDSMVSIRKKSNRKSHLGLGLFVAHKIAEFHGGSIQAQNREDGTHGVVFTIILPVQDALNSSSA